MKLDECAAEIIRVAFPRTGNGFALGIVVEYEHPAESRGARTINAGPILEFKEGF